MSKIIAAMLLAIVLFAGCATASDSEALGAQPTAAATEPIIRDNIPTTATDISIDSTPAPTPTPAPATETELAYGELRMAGVPNLAAFAADYTLLTPEGWTLLDSAEFDYNRDGLTDIVGILNRYGDDSSNWYPRILFVARQSAEGGYILDFEDINLVRSYNEGGVFGDPYLPLAASDNSFTISTFGGSAWKWREETEFEYRDGQWFLATLSVSNGFGWVTTTEYFYDYRIGVGLRRENNTDFKNIEALTQMYEERSDSVDAIFELEFEVKLSAAPTLWEYSQRWQYSTDRIREIHVSDVRIAEGVEIAVADVPIPLQGNGFDHIDYADENYILYTFRTYLKTFLAIYDRATCVVDVICMKDGDGSYGSGIPFDYPQIYDGRIYYSSSTAALLPTLRNGEITEEYQTIYSQIISMKLDGSDEQVLFQYDREYVEGEIVEGFLPYISLIISHIGEDEMIFWVYSEPKKYYRMSLDGTNLQLIGELNGFYERDGADG